MMDKKVLNINKDIVEGVVIIRLFGSLNAYTAPKFETMLKDTIDENPRIILDLCNLNYISSIGLGVIIGYVEDAREKGGDIRIFLKDNSIVEEIFEITGFPKIIKFFDDNNSGIKSFKTDGS